MEISGAFIQLNGVISHSLSIKQTLNGEAFGLLRVAVDKEIGIVEETKEPIYGTRRYAAFIWNKELLTTAKELLTKGKSVRLFGELDYIPVRILPSDVFLANAPEDGLLLTINITKISSDTQRKGSKDTYYSKNKFSPANTKTALIQNSLEGCIQ